MDSFTYIIVNALEYNERANRSNFTWFKFYNQYFTSQGVFSSGMEAKLLFMFLLCEASKNNWKEKLLRFEYISLLSKIPVDKIENAIHELNENNMIEVIGGIMPRNTAQCRVIPHNDGKRRGEERRGDRAAARVGCIEPLTTRVENPRRLDRVKHELQQLWINRYGLEATLKEINKAIEWEIANNDTKKNFGTFMSNWLSRSKDISLHLVAKEEQADNEKIRRGLRAITE